MYSPAFHLLLKRSISYLKYSMEGITCKIFIVQFTFIGISYDNKIFPLIFSISLRFSIILRITYSHFSSIAINNCPFQKVKFR